MENSSTNSFWQQAIANELRALDKSHTWNMVDLTLSKFSDQYKGRWYHGLLQSLTSGERIHSEIWS